MLRYGVLLPLAFHRVMAGASDLVLLGTHIPTPSVAEPPAPCFRQFALPPDAVVFAAGAYSGRRIDFQIDQSGHEAGQIDVSVNYPGKPVVLLLTAYDPTIWNIKRIATTKIIAVVASGYHRQAIAGIDQNTPQLISTSDHPSECGYFYATADKLNGLNSHARRVFGRGVDTFCPADKGSVLIGTRPPAGAHMIGSAVTAATFYDRTAPLSGQAGLDAAVRAGTLRKATGADSDAWFSAVRQQSGPPDEPRVAGDMKGRKQSLPLYRVVV